MQYTFLKGLIATLILILHYADGRFIVTADSRAVIKMPGYQIFTDNACKIQALDQHLIFLESGYPQATRQDGSVIFDELATAEKIVRLHHNEYLTRNTVNRIANEWKVQMQADIRAYLKNPELGPLPGGMVGVFLASLTNGQPYGIIEHITISGEVVSSLITTDFIGIGDTDGTAIAVNKLHAGHRAHTLPEDPVLALYNIETDTIADLHSSLVALPVDEAVLSSRQGITWIHRKPNCR